MAGCWRSGQLFVLAVFLSFSCLNAIFVRQSWLDKISTNRRNYGVAVSDVNHDGKPDFIVAGYSRENFVFVYDEAKKEAVNIAQKNSPYEALMDVDGDAIGVAACDIDGDGKEEIYFLNTNQAYAGVSDYGDKIFKWRNGHYENLYSDPVNIDLPAKGYAGRSVACIDRHGTGKYGFALATYSSRGQGRFALIEMDETHKDNDVSKGQIVLKNFGVQAKIARATGGRGIAVGPILGNNGRSDIFFGNEGSFYYKNSGANNLFMNLGNGIFKDIASSANIEDSGENVRGITLGDFNKDGKIDIAYGNWDGPHRLYLQKTGYSVPSFENKGDLNRNYSSPTHIRTVIAADFDNNGNLEIFQNNIFYQGHDQPNKLFTIVPIKKDISIIDLDIGEAEERKGYGTGAAVTDFDGDGKLDLLISRGEGSSQPLQVYSASTGSENNWIRVQPKTRQGGPARGAAVEITTNSGVSHLHVIDGGSGYLCQMEPYAHIGLGQEIPKKLSIQWPDGVSITKTVTPADMKKVHVVDYPVNGGSKPKPKEPENCPPGKWTALPYKDYPVLCEGDRVTRGPGWRWGNEDNGSTGTVIKPAQQSYLSYYTSQGDPHWVMVRWDYNRVTLPYRMGSRDVQDLCRCSDCGVDPRCGNCSC